MNTSFLTYNEQLTLLKGAYFEAVVSYNESHNNDALSRLFASEDAYFLQIGAMTKVADLRNFIPNEMRIMMA